MKWQKNEISRAINKQCPQKSMNQEIEKHILHDIEGILEVTEIDGIEVNQDLKVNLRVYSHLTDRENLVILKLTKQPITVNAQELRKAIDYCTNEAYKVGPMNFSVK